MNYEKDLSIDDSALDLCCLDQPMLFMRYAKYASETRRDLDTAKQNLEIVKAELDKQIRDNPEDFGITKITEGAIQSAILTNKNYSEAYKEFSVSKYEADMAQNAVTAMNTRKDMLEQLIKLYGQSYFAGPKVPRDLAKERSLKENKTDSGINKKLTRR